MSTVEWFLAHLPASARDRLSSRSELAANLRAVVDGARAAYPTVSIDESSFLQHVARRLPDRDPAASLLTVRAADLYLACACLAHHPAALSLLEVDVLRVAAFGLRRVIAHVEIDEVAQQLREKLLLGPSPKLADYRGRGLLVSWVRTVALRLAMDKLRTRAPETAELPDIPDSSLDPALRVLRDRHGAEFRAAIAEALAAMSVQERNVLRLHYLDGLTIDQLAALFHVHRATTARWIERSRSRLFELARELLGGRLQLAGAELDSVLRALVSDLHISLHRLLVDAATSN